MASIVSRILKLTAHGGSFDIQVSISLPTLDQHTWTCLWTIDWPDRRRSNVGCGVDAMQALVLALQMVGTEIYCSAEHQSGKLSWNDDTTGYGFPVPNNLRDLLIGDDAKYL